MECSNPLWQQPHSPPLPSPTIRNENDMKKTKIGFLWAAWKFLPVTGRFFNHHAIFSEISVIFRKYRDIFGSRKYRDILSVIFRLAENIAIFSNIANILAILSMKISSCCSKYWEEWGLDFRDQTLEAERLGDEWSTCTQFILQSSKLWPMMLQDTKQLAQKLKWRNRDEIQANEG